MIYVFGDSHANFNMKGFDLPHTNLYCNSITMHRIGRDNIIINFNPIYNNSNNVFLLYYGEIDCRCHIHRQILLGRKLLDIVEELVQSYFKTIANNITSYNKIIISSITPPVSRVETERVNGVITHEFPMVGTDEERSLYCRIMNQKLKEYCSKYNYLFLDTYSYYADENGILYFNKSDRNCHIVDNAYLHNEIKKLL